MPICFFKQKDGKLRAILMMEEALVYKKDHFYAIFLSLVPIKAPDSQNHYSFNKSNRLKPEIIKNKYKKHPKDGIEVIMRQ